MTRYDNIEEDSGVFSSSMDEELFESYGRLINSSYPNFLRRLGINTISVKAEGAVITDSRGDNYIDCVAGYGLFNIGHNNPKLIDALIEQLREGQLLTKPFITDIHVKLAEYLYRITPGDLCCSFICNSGSEAIDNAIKLVRLCKGEKKIIAAQNSFHGYTYGALSASGISSFKRLFKPIVPDFVHIPFNDIKSLQDAIDNDTAAVLLEPIQHESGVFLPSEGYFREVRNICDENGIILILDEIKTGIGKTGHMFACEHFPVVPDILVLGKSLGGGVVPIGALIAKKRLWKKFGLSFPMSASSFAGNTLACRAALTTIQILKEGNLLEDCLEKGLFILNELNKYINNYPNILKDVNGHGLLIGIKVTDSQIAHRLSEAIIKQHILIFPAFANPSVLMIEPPLVISFEQIQKVLKAFKIACEELSQNI